MHLTVPDGLHASLSQKLEVRTSPISGRGIYANECLKQGSVIISIKPHISVLSSQYLDSFCTSCAGRSPIGGLKRCTECHTVWYCNAKCQNTDWNLHKFECSALRRWANSAPQGVTVPDDAVRCLGRILWKTRKEGAKSVWTKEIHSMQTLRQSLAPTTQSAELHTHLAHSLVHYLSVSSPSELAEFGIASAAELVDVISRFTTNTFTFSTPDLTPIGISISPLVALINHSCDPNAVVVFPRASGSLSSQTQQPTMQVIGLKEIAAGEEILTSYVDTTLPTSARQASLQETYHFTCSCVLCSTPPVDPRAAMWCYTKCGGTSPLPVEKPTRCVKCNSTIPASQIGAISDAVRIGQEALDKATAIQFLDPTAALRLTTNILPILLSAGLTPSSHPLLAINRLHQLLLISRFTHECITQENLDEAIRTAARSSTGLESILTRGHPVRGIAQVELGKLLAVDEPSPPAPLPITSTAEFPPSGPRRLMLAYQTLVKARDELLIGFGKDNGGGEVGRDVREEIVRLERELGIWRDGVRNIIEDTPRLKENKLTQSTTD